MTAALTTAQRKLVEGNVKFAYWLVNRHIRLHPEYEGIRRDLEQEALLAMCGAAAAFDPKRRETFITYAKLPVRSAIWETALESRSLIVRKRMGDRGSGGIAPAVKLEPQEAIEQVVVAHPAEESADLKGIEEKARAAMVTSQVAAWKKIRSTGMHASQFEPAARRNANIFLKARFGEEDHKQLGKAYGISGQAIRQAAARAEVHFDQWAAKVRSEAA